MKPSWKSLLLFASLVAICGGYICFKSLENYQEKRIISFRAGEYSFIGSPSLILTNDELGARLLYRFDCINDKDQMLTYEECWHQKYIEEAEENHPNAPAEYLEIIKYIAKMDEPNRNLLNRKLTVCNAKFASSMAATIHCYNDPYDERTP